MTPIGPSGRAREVGNSRTKGNRKIPKFLYWPDTRGKNVAADERSKNLLLKKTKGPGLKNPEERRKKFNKQRRKKKKYGRFFYSALGEDSLGARVQQPS